MEKERFLAYRDLHREVYHLRRQLEHMEELMYSPNYQRFTSTPNALNGKGRTMACAVTEHIELERLLKGKTRELLSEMLCLERAIETLESPIERAIMRYRYFEGMSWDEIRIKLNYCRQQVYRYHGYALAHLKDYPEGFREIEAPVVVESYKDFKEA